MPQKLSEKARKNKASYDMQYMHKNIRRKLIPFNMQNAEDKAIFDWLDDQENMTRYVKDLILADMPETGK